MKTTSLFFTQTALLREWLSVLSKLILLALFSLPVAAQTAVNGQQIIPCTSAVTFDPTCASGYLDLTCAVTSVSIPKGYGGRPYHLTIKQDGGSYPTTMPANISGDTTLNPTGYTYIRQVWDEPSQVWVTTRIGLAPTTGPQGATGATGSQGVAGPTGSTGPAGSTGAQGATGLTGAAGATGITGSAGPIGPTGVAGSTGQAGSNGATGAAGPMGLQGVAGPAGATGGVGAVGQTGATGAVGATGAQGSQGIQGATGLAGATGPQGPALTRLSGTTGSIGGSLLALGACATGTAAVTGATPGMVFSVTRTDGTFIGGGFMVNATVITAGTVSVNVCAYVAGTPPAKSYSVLQ